MEILGRKGLSGMIKLFIDLILLGGVTIFIGLPFILNWCFLYILNTDKQYYPFILGFLYFTGFFALIIIYELRKIFVSLNDKNPFVMSTVKSLRKIARASLIVSCAYIVKIIVLNSIFTMIITMVFVMAGLFSIILAEVFKQAVVVKEENDLTI